MRDSHNGNYPDGIVLDEWLSRCLADDQFVLFEHGATYTYYVEDEEFLMLKIKHPLLTKSDPMVVCRACI